MIKELMAWRLDIYRTQNVQPLYIRLCHPHQPEDRRYSLLSHRYFNNDDNLNAYKVALEPDNPATIYRVNYDLKDEFMRWMLKNNIQH